MVAAKFGTLDLLMLDSDEDAQPLVGKRVVVTGVADSDIEGTIIRANRFSFVLETDRGKVKVLWHKLVKVLDS